MMERNEEEIALIASVIGKTRRGKRFSVASGKTVEIMLLEEFTVESVGFATRDCEILGEILKEYPEDISMIIEAVGAGRLEDAKTAAKRIGIAEDNFHKQGGGMWALIALAVACAIFLEHD